MLNLAQNWITSFHWDVEKHSELWAFGDTLNVHNCDSLEVAFSNIWKTIYGFSFMIPLVLPATQLHSLAFLLMPVHWRYYHSINCGTQGTGWSWMRKERMEKEPRSVVTEAMGEDTDHNCRKGQSSSSLSPGTFCLHWRCGEMQRWE